MKFACPHCGQRVEAAEEWAGQNVPCPSCGQALVIPARSTKPLPKAPPIRRPGSPAPVVSPEPKRRGGRGFVGRLVVFALILLAGACAYATYALQESPGQVWRHLTAAVEQWRSSGSGLLRADATAVAADPSSTPAPAPAPEAPAPASDPRERIARAVDAVIEAETGDRETAERMRAYVHEHLIEGEDYDRYLHQPWRVVVQAICADLGLHPDWAAWDNGEGFKLKDSDPPPNPLFPRNAGTRITDPVRGYEPAIRGP